MNRIVLDTETANSLEEPIAYDIGWAVIDDNYTVIKTESYAVLEVFTDKEFMASAYYADKVPQYWDDIRNGSRKLARLSTIVLALNNDVKAYGVTEVYAHNARFDYRSTTLTQRYITSSKYYFMLPKSVTFFDTLKMSRQAFGKDKEYIDFCKSNDFMTKHKTPRPRLTAEVIYRFLTGDTTFTEEHQGLADVLIEKDILKACRERGVQGGKLWE